MFTLMQQGGIVMWAILACGLAALAVFLERAFHVHRARIKTDDFLKGVCNILRRHNLAEAVTICDETPGPVARMVRAAIPHHAQSGEAIERAMHAAGLNEMARLERRISVLALLAQIAPLLGLLGTVIGLIRTFWVVQQEAPLLHAGLLADGVWQALLTTAFGLGVALFSHVAHHLLWLKVDAIGLDMERAMGEMTGFFRSVPAAESRPPTE